MNFAADFRNSARFNLPVRDIEPAAETAARLCAKVATSSATICHQVSCDNIARENAAREFQKIARICWVTGR